MAVDKVKKEQLLEKYNEFIEELSETKDITREDYSKEEEKWMKKPFTEGEQDTPENILREISEEITEEEMDEFFDRAAEISYWSIPKFMNDLMKEHGKMSEEILVRRLLAGEKYVIEDGLYDVEDEELGSYEKFVVTLRFAPELDNDNVDKVITELFEKTGNEEQIVDAFEDAFLKMKSEKVVRMLENREQFGIKESAPCQALVTSGNKSEEIFRVLKRAFKKTEEKELYGMILTDYGDGRAVTVLRKEMMKLAEVYGRLEPETDERNTVFQALMLYNNFIVSLGGTTEDIM